MVLIEILIPDKCKKLYISATVNTAVRAIKERICKVVCPGEREAVNVYRFLEPERLLEISDELTLKEAGLVNGSRLLFVTE